jgi:hypothetical protein
MTRTAYQEDLAGHLEQYPYDSISIIHTEVEVEVWWVPT